MSATALNPLRIVSDVWRHRYLLGQLIKRDVLLRYRGAMFGVLWIFLSPLLMLAIFAFIFGQVFQTRWPQQNNGLPFWLLLYGGLITFNIFAETVSRAPASVRGYPSFVKKIIFPVHILPVVPLGAALVHGIFNFLILVAALAWVGGLHGQIVLFPLLLLPVLLLALGLSWFVAAWGVFIKDMTQILPVFVQMLMFLSPVFYPMSAVPAALRRSRRTVSTMTRSRCCSRWLQPWRRKARKCWSGSTPRWRCRCCRPCIRPWLFTTAWTN